MVRATLFLQFILFNFCFAQGIELCNNAIDDDQDGLIDLLDPDCICGLPLPPSPIPNPSFEEQDCCPLSPSQMACVSHWMQGSEPTTDYSHACGWQEFPELDLPLPLPDGDGCIGFRNGTANPQGGNSPHWKEYATVCLNSPLRAGEQYTFEFYIGFADHASSEDVRIAFFGAEDCENLFFGEGEFGFGCPSRDSKWKHLGAVDVELSRSWVKASLSFHVVRDIYAISIGPDCNLTNSGGSYLFLDNIVLIERSDYNPNVFHPTHPCDTAANLIVNARDGYGYQWYKDGIALIGEEDIQLSRFYGEGMYQVRMESALGECELTEPFVYEKGVIRDSSRFAICDGSLYLFGNELLGEAGVYSDTLLTREGCDSIIFLDLQVKSDFGDTIEVKIFPGESYQIGRKQYVNPGEYRCEFESADGCDSTVFLRLSHYKIHAPNAFSPNGDGINEYFSLVGGDEVTSIYRLRIFNRWGKPVYEGKEILPSAIKTAWDGKTNGQAAPEGVYVYTADVLFDDGKIRRVSGSVVVMR